MQAATLCTVLVMCMFPSVPLKCLHLSNQPQEACRHQIALCVPLKMQAPGFNYSSLDDLAKVTLAFVKAAPGLKQPDVIAW